MGLVADGRTEGIADESEVAPCRRAGRRYTSKLPSIPRPRALAMPHDARILAIHAHPDDVEFQCAGTLALLRQRGCHVTIATMTPGDCGTAEYDAEEIADDPPRRGEGRRRPDRGRVPLPGVPRPGGLQRRPLAPPRRRVPPSRPARPGDDGPPDRLPRPTTRAPAASSATPCSPSRCRTTRRSNGSPPRRWRRSRTSTSSTRSTAAIPTACPSPPASTST